MKNIILEFIHTNRILNFKMFFSRNLKRKSNCNIIGYQLSTVQSKSGQNYPLLIKQPGCLLVPGAVSGPRDMRLVRLLSSWCLHFIVLEETDHTESSELTNTAVSAMKGGL